MRIADVQLTFPAILIALLVNASQVLFGIGSMLCRRWPCSCLRSDGFGSIRAHRAQLRDG